MRAAKKRIYWRGAGLRDTVIQSCADIKHLALRAAWQARNLTISPPLMRQRQSLCLRVSDSFFHPGILIGGRSCISGGEFESAHQLR